MPKKSRKNLLLSLAAFLFISCSRTPTYSRQDIDETIEEICQNEHGITVNAALVNDTLWIFAPVEMFDEKGQWKISQEGKTAEDLSESMRKISQSIQRALLNLDNPPLFYCLIKSDVQRTEGINFVRFNQYEIVFVPDQIRLMLASYGLNMQISSHEFEKRVILFQAPFIESKILNDNQGKSVPKYNIGLAEFIRLLIQQGIFRTFLSPEVKDNYTVNDIDIQYTAGRLEVNFDIAIRQYESGIARPLKKIEEITKEVLDNYADFLGIETAVINDQFNHKVKAITLKSFADKSDAKTLSQPQEDSADTLYNLAKANFYLIQGAAYAQGESRNFHKAALCNQKALQVLPKYLYAYIALGETYLQSGKYPEALEVLQQAVQLDNANPTAYFYLGEAYRMLGKPKEALEQFRQVFLREPGYPGIMPALSSLYAELGIPEESLVYLKKAIKQLEDKKSTDPESYRNIGNIYTRLGQYQEALPYLLKAKEIDPSYLPTYISLGETYRLMGNSQEAINYFQKALLLDPGSLAGQIGLAHTYLALGQYQKAISAYENILKTTPESLDIYLALAQSHNELGVTNQDQAEQQKALAYLKKAQKLNADNFKIYYQFGITYSNLGEYKKAIQYFQKALNMNADSPEIYFGLGQAYHSLGENEPAKENFQQAQELFYRSGDYPNAQKAEENLRNIPN